MSDVWSSRSFAYGMVFVGALLAAATCSSVSSGPPAAPPAAITAERPAAAPPNVRIPEYMTPELRRKVEALKADVARAPSTPETVDERAEILFDWMNAYALTGRFVPVNLSTAVTAVAFPGLATRAQCNQIDSFIAELRLNEEQPDQLGAVAVDNLGPFPVGSWQTLVQTYTVGSRPIEKGGGLMLGRHFMTNQGVYQTDDPTKDNYVSVRSSNPSVRINVTKAPLGGMFGGFRGAVPMPFFEVADGELKPGDKVVITIGDTSGGGRGFRMQSFANDGLRLPLFLRFDANADFLSLPPALFSLSGGPVARVRGFAPSTARVGERIVLSVRGEDTFRNRATGAQPAYDVFVNGERAAQVPAGDKAITLVDSLSFPKPGVYRISFRSVDGKVTGDTNPILVHEGSRPGIYWGETHAHSAFAEGQGTIDFFYQFGRDDARLDFVGMSEHDTWMDDFEWRQMQDAVKRYDRPGEFIPFLAYEWTAPTIFGGHHNVFYRTSEGRERSAVQQHPTLTSLYEGLKSKNDPKDVLVIPHAHATGEYRINDGEIENLVEILSLHGSFEWFGQRYLEQGHEVGFIAASDDHLSHPGYAAGNGNLTFRSGLAAVVAPTKSRDSLFDAMKARRTYATTGDRIILDYDVSGGSFGQRIANTDKRVVKLRAIGTAPIREITVVKNGKDAFSQAYMLDRTGRSNRLAVQFQSSSDPQVRDNARGWRRWEGTLTVKGARLDGFDAPGSPVSAADFVRRADGKPQTLDISIGTRGSANTIYLDLAGVTRGASIELDLQPAREFGTPLVSDPYHEYPAMTYSLPLARMQQGVYGIDSPGAVTPDRISIQSILKDAPMEQSIEWTDPGPARPDDNYYVRVIQANEGAAYTSPVWVGGFSRTDQ
jgi:hypothetical protein